MREKLQARDSNVMEVLHFN